MTDETEMETWMAKVEAFRRAGLLPRIDEMVMSVPLRMTFEMPKPDPVKFIIGQRFGGFDVQPRGLRFITNTHPGPRHYHTGSWRKTKRARCKARRRARLPRRHWVARARRGER